MNLSTNSIPVKENQSGVKKKLIKIVLAVLVLGVIFVFILSRERIESKEFIGSVKGVENGEISASGVFSVPEKEDWAKDSREVTITISPETKISKVLVFLPTREELKKTEGYFDGSKLRRETRQSDLETLKKDSENRSANIFVKSSVNIYGKQSFLADEIIYEVEYIPRYDD